MRKFLGIEVDENEVRIEEQLVNGYGDDDSTPYDCARIAIFDKNGNQIYWENWFGYWMKQEFDEDNRLTYYEYKSGDWERRWYENGKLVYIGEKVKNEKV